MRERTMAELLCFRVVKVTLPQSKLRKLIKKIIIRKKDRRIALEKIKEIDEAMNKLSHAKSIVEKILLKEDIE